MFVGALLLLMTSFTGSAQGGDWPTIKDIYVGDTFKYPLLGVPGHEVRPTQAAVGFRAVAEKKKEMEKMIHDELKDALKRDPIPVVAAPDGNFYIIDHHHQALAAHQAGRETAFFILNTNYSKLSDMDEFWARMEEKKWVRAFDYLGRPIKIPEGLPKSILKMLDDPFRSLAWFVRKLGGYRKTAVEYAEFLWADFFRTRIGLGSSDKDFKSAVKEGEAMAHTEAAKALPGWNPKRLNCANLFDR